MLQITTTEQIAAPPAVVWAFISDLGRIPEWVIGTKQMLSISTNEVGAGTEYRELTQIGPSTSPTTWRVTTFRAPHVQIHESHSATGDIRLIMTFEAQNGGTRFSHQIEAQMLPRLRPLGWLVERLLRRRVASDMRQTLRQARQIIEREYGAVERTQSQPLRADHAVAAS